MWNLSKVLTLPFSFFVEGEDDADTMRKVGKKLKLTPCQKKAKTNTTQEGIRISNVRIFSFLFWNSEDKLERHLMKNSKGWKERIHMKPFSIFKEMLRQSCVDIYINQYATLIQFVANSTD